MTPQKQIAELRSALMAALDWIDTVPSDTVLPTMPGFDRDQVNQLIEDTKPLRVLTAEAQAAGMNDQITLMVARLRAMELATCSAAADLLEKMAAAPAAPDELREIGRLLATQNNRITDQPLFIVQQKRSYVTDDDYSERYEWRETESGDHIEASPLRAARLELLHKHYRETPGWQRFAMFDVWEFVTACFTEQGCKDYLRINGHNLKETRIYADGSFRNHEYQAVRSWLLSLHTPEGNPA